MKTGAGACTTNHSTVVTLTLLKAIVDRDHISRVPTRFDAFGETSSAVLYSSTSISYGTCRCTLLLASHSKVGQLE